MNGKKYDTAHVAKMIDEGTLDQVKMLDLLGSHEVEITLNEDGRLWINIMGRCVLRVKHAKIIGNTDVA